LALAQTDRQDSIITFYTTDAPGRAGAPIVYANGKEVGEVTNGQFIRLIGRPGTYQFALVEDAEPAQQLSVSISGGQKIFLRVTRTAFFYGSAAEANASLKTVTPNSAVPKVNAGNTASLMIPSAAPETITPINSPADPRSDPGARSARIKQSLSSQGIPGVLRCAFDGTLSVHATIQPGSPVVGEIRCGDPVFLIDPRLGATHVITQHGKDGFILGHNLGQWSIQTGLSERATAAIPPSALPPTMTTGPSIQAVSERPIPDPILPPVPPVSLTANLISPSTSAPVLAPDLILLPESVPAAPADVILPYASGSATRPDPLPAPAPPLVPAPDLIVPDVPGPAPLPIASSILSDPPALAMLLSMPAPAPPPEAISAPVSTPDALSASALAPDTAAGEDYLIGPADVLAISVWGEPDLSTKATVRSDGKIALQLLDDVQASGLTTSRLREYLGDGFSKYLKNPVVSVILIESHSKLVYVLGSVAKPGSYPLNGPLTVIELLVRAGGFAEFAKTENVVIMRYDGGTPSRMLFNYKNFVSGKNVEQNILLQSRDLVIVP
jgi:polysaccharide export outer membrane protein